MFAGYIVKDKKFKNTWQAVDYAESIKSHVEFEYHNDVFCNLKGLRVDQDRDYRTPYLKELFKKEQNLFYTGGSDSQTILELSEKNGLEWQSLVTVLSAPTIDGEANNEYLPGIEYAKKNNHNLEIWNHDIEYWEEIYSDPKFMYKNAGELNFRPDYVQFGKKLDPNKNYVTGLEKPILIYYEGRWFTFQKDIEWTSFGGLDNVTHFFLNPDRPEIYIQDCRSVRDHFVSKATPENGTLVYNQLLNRSTINNYEIKKTNQQVVNDKNSLAVKQLWKMGRFDIIEKWIEIAKNHVNNHQYGVTWDKNFAHHALLSWLIDIDSLESVNKSEFHNMLFSNKSIK